MHADSEGEYAEMCNAEGEAEQEAIAQEETYIDVAIEQLGYIKKLNDQRNEMTAAIDTEIAELTIDVKQYVVESKNSIEIKGAWVNYIKSGERTSWNAKELAKIAKSNAEVAKCRTVTETAANAAIKLDV